MIGSDVQIKIYLRAEASHSVLNDVKIFVREEPEGTGESLFSTNPGAGFIEQSHDDQASSNHHFDVVSA